MKDTPTCTCSAFRQLFLLRAFSRYFPHSASEDGQDPFHPMWLVLSTNRLAVILQPLSMWLPVDPQKNFTERYCALGR